jgi:hypothetical protein
MLGSFTKKRLVAAVGVVAALAGAGAAVAFFTGSSGSNTGSATVGSSTAWSVSSLTSSWAGTLTALYPGATNDTELFSFTVTNSGNGSQNLKTITPAVKTDTTGTSCPGVSCSNPNYGDAETAGGSDIPGCLASWFTVVDDPGNPALPNDLAAAGTYSGKVDLTMQDSGTSQDSCQGASPGVTVTASSA